MPGRIKLQMTNARDATLGESVDVTLLHLQTGSRQLVRRQGNRTITITGLREPPQGLYRVEVDPPSYLPVGAFANTGNADAVRLVFPVDAAKVTGTKFPTFTALSADSKTVLTAGTQVLGFENVSGETLWEGLDEIRRAGFLNIMAKTSATAFANGRAVASYFKQLLEIRGDRFFVTVPHELREETKNAAVSGLFTSVDGSLHHPPKDFTLAGSFKTQDRYGNLQLTFFSDGSEWRADVDIDDAAGLEHVFQVVRNAVAGRPTHPFDIHEILLVHQRIDPGYDLLVAGDD
jgi:hypothetical protein